MSTKFQNLNHGSNEETNSSENVVSEEHTEEAFGSFQGFDSGLTEELNLGSAAGSTEAASQDDALGSAFFQMTQEVSEVEVRQVPFEKSDGSYTEADTQDNTTCKVQPSMTTSIRDIKKKIPGLVDLTLPTTPRTPGFEINPGDVPSSDSSDSSEACPPLIPPLLRRISIPAHSRLKTRLQDPPPLTPAVQNQLTHCSSSLLRRRSSVILANEQQNPRPEGGSASSKPSSDGADQTNAANLNSNLSGSFDLKSNMFAPPVPDEDRDPLDDDIIPASKKRKTQENKCATYLQWISLLLLIAFLACSMKIKFLKTAPFLGLDLWRWEALTLVVFCGRLISGWIMKILWCLFTASLSWMLKVLAVKVAANSFHRTAYFDRIQECIFNQYLLEVLSGPPTMAGIADTGFGQDEYKKQLTRTEKKKHKNQSSHDLDSHKSGEAQVQRLQKTPTPYMQRSRRLSRQISIETPGYTAVEVGELPAPVSSNAYTPSRRRVSLTNQGPLIARSPIPIEQDKLQELTSDTVSVWTLRRLMKLIRKTNISTYSSIISQETEEGEISSEVQAKAAAKQALK